MKYTFRNVESTFTSKTLTEVAQCLLRSVGWLVFAQPTRGTIPRLLAYELVRNLDPFVGTIDTFTKGEDFGDVVTEMETVTFSEKGTKVTKSWAVGFGEELEHFLFPYCGDLCSFDDLGLDIQQSNFLHDILSTTV